MFRLTGWLPCTSLGQVALHMSVCLSGRMRSTILRICGSKPMSNILSASSRTRYVHRRRLILPVSRKSISLPGVAIQMSIPSWRARICGPLGAPPYTQVLVTRQARPNVSTTVWTCWASSLVGANTRTCVCVWCVCVCVCGYRCVCVCVKYLAGYHIEVIMLKVPCVSTYDWAISPRELWLVGQMNHSR